MRYILVALGLTLLPVSAGAQAIRDFCQSSKKDLQGDAKLSSAAKAVFPHARFVSRDDDCIYPIKVLRYGDADVLLTSGNTPGETCHGCAAKLSAYVLQRAPAGPRLVAKFVDFDTSGTFGNPGDIDPVQLAGDDAFAVEAGGMFQGYSSSGVSFYIFRAGRLEKLTPSLPISADDTGAMTDDKNAVSVEGAWRIDPARPDTVTISYKVEAKGRTTRASATWRLDQNQLKLSAGRVPAELDTAGGK